MKAAESSRTTRSTVPGAVLLLVAGLALSAPPGATAQTRPPLGTNLSGLTEFSTELPLVDAFKTSRPWVSGTQGVWDDGRSLDVDARGWVRSLQPGQIARTVLLWDIAPHYPSGQYVVLYQGQGVIVYTPNARRIQSSAGRDVLQVDSSQTGIGLSITAVNPANYLRNIQVLMPVGAAAGALFNPTFIDRIRNYRVIRFSTWMLGMNQLVVQEHWDDRPTLDDARWRTKGAPVEVMVALANQLHADPWFTIPHLADDDYVRQFAQAVRDSLDPTLHVYVEHSNEVFNLQFPQALYARDRGLALGLSTDPAEAQIRYHAQRSREIFGIFEEVFPPERLVRVLGTWANSTWVSQTALNFSDTRAHTDALAIAPYFIVPASALETALSMNLDDLFGYLQTVSVPQAQNFVRQQVAVANSYGLPVISYEGGQDLKGTIDYLTNPTLNTLFDAANRDARMGTLYSQYLQNWTDAGGQLFMHFVNCYAYRYGRVGSLEYIDQPRAEAPKYDALLRWIEGR